MAKKKEVYKVKQLNENKKNIIAALIDEYDIETADDIQEALKDLLGGTIKSMMEAEMDEHLGYERYERNDGDNGHPRHRSFSVQNTGSGGAGTNAVQVRLSTLRLIPLIMFFPFHLLSIKCKKDEV